MGIERFFSSMEHHGGITGDTIKLINKPIDGGNHLLIDFNSIIHVVSQRVVNDLNFIIYDFIKNKVPDKLLNKYKIKETVMEDFQKWCNQETNIDNLIIDEVINEMLNIIKTLVDTKKLKSIYIGIDGVPSKGKIQEQKQRRYMGAVISSFKKHIFAKYEKEMSRDKIRYNYEMNKISWNKNLITPSTLFMDIMYYKLIDQHTIKQINNICPKLKYYRVSGPYESGEGEKKIVNYIYNNFEPESKYLIYSPDADITLLALLLTVKRNDGFMGVKKIIILRHNQQTNQHNSMDIEILGTNIHNFIKKEVPKISYNQAINEIVFIFTVFGNDFLPKIESFNVKNDFEFIIHRYIGLLQKFPDHIMIEEVSGGKLHLNLQVFMILIKILHFDEGGQLQRSYISNKYRNVEWFKKIIGTDQHNLLNKMGDLLKQIKKIFDRIDNNQSFDDYITPELKKILEKIFRKDNLTDQQLIDQINANHYKLRNDLKLHPYERTIKEKFHQDKIKTFGHEVITEYDKEVYQFENMLDNYREKLSAYPVDLGRIWLGKKSWAWEAEKIERGVERFYYSYFGIDKMNRTKLDNLMYEYMFGIFWVFNYYYNEYDDKMLQTVSTWYYPHHKSPLMTQLYSYLNRANLKELIKKLMTDLIKTRVNRIDFFNCIEQFMYVSPASSILKLMPDIYHKFVRESGYYPDLDKLVEDFISGKQKIDCRGALFLNKCHLNIQESKMSDIEFIRSLREIPITDDIRHRQGKNGGDVEIFEYKLGPK